MSERARLSPVPLILAALLAVAALAFSRGSSPSARSGPTGHTSPSPGQASPSAGLTAPSGPPACARGDVLTPAPEYVQWRRTLLDTSYRLPKGYVPPDLAAADSAGLGRGVVVRSLVIKDLTALQAAATAAGHPLGVVAAYRSFDQQQSLFALRVKELGRTLARQRVAQPGHSEHELGTALDFNSQGMADVSVGWGRSPTGRWAARNAWRFGFVLSYPKDGSDVTCYPYEPWHFRYVGRRVAAAVHASGLTLREYLWREAGSPTATPSVP
jgi:D-alanyl-D-alanine carboxypeptidase